MDCLNIYNDVKDTLEENKVNNSNNENSLENINKRTEIELSKVFGKYNVSYNIINV